MNETWLCTKCHSRNNIDRANCGFCSAPKPEVNQNTNESIEANKLSQAIHIAVDKMNHMQRLRVWRWLEDNII